MPLYPVQVVVINQLSKPNEMQHSHKSTDYIFESQIGHFQMSKLSIH